MSTPLHDTDTAFGRSHLTSWLVFAAAAGAVNAMAFLASERFVTHVTGAVTQIGLTRGAWLLVAEYALVLGCFIAGAMVSVPLVHRTRARLAYAAPLVGTVALLLAVAGFGALGWFGTFAGDITTGQSFGVLSLLGFAMGLQNATVAAATPLGLRTTHMTGPASDVGFHLGIAVGASQAPRRAALRLAALRGGTLLAFIVGAAIAVPIASGAGYLAFLVPAGMVAGATLQSLTHRKGEPPHDLATDDRGPGAHALA